MGLKIRFPLVGFAVVLSAALSVSASLEPGLPFADGMVLQRGMPVPVWGSADAGAKVTVSFGGCERTVCADSEGRWMARLDPLEASGEGRTLRLCASSPDGTVSTRELRDVLVGEVWFASGQSNMDCPIWGDNARYRDAKGSMTVAMSRKPAIRYVANQPRSSVRPVTTGSVVWRKLTPEDFALPGKKISAVACYYALEIHNALGVPVGIVQSALGDTSIDAWTPACGYEGIPELADLATYPLDRPWTDDMKVFPITGEEQRPTVLWNGMVAGFAPMALRGVIWYQGCHNGYTIREQRRYGAKLRALYRGWSRAFGNGNLRFYFAMLAPWQRNWFELQLAQASFAAEEPNAAVAVLCDCGNPDDIHPNDKEIVAKRLAAHALRRDYGFEALEDDSPTVRACRAEGKTLVLELDHAKAVYVYNRNRSTEAPFELAGEEGVWLPAKIVNFPTERRDGRDVPDCGGFLTGGARIVLRADGLDRPLRCRYLYQRPWIGCVYADSSLPLGPFEVQAVGCDGASKETK